MKWMPALAITAMLFAQTAYAGMDITAPHLEIVSATTAPSDDTESTTLYYPSEVTTNGFTTITASVVGNHPDIEYVELIFRPLGMSSWNLIDADLVSPDGVEWNLEGAWNNWPETSGWYEVAAVGVDRTGNVDQWPGIMRFYAMPALQALSGAQALQMVTAVPSVSAGPVQFRLGSALPSNATLNVYDASGRRVATLETPKGAAAIDWNGQNSHGVSLPSGVYFARLDRAPYNAPARIIITR